MLENPFGPGNADELTSPEQLDDAIQVASPLSWLAVGILLFIVVATFAWSLFGTVRTRVHGDGLLMYDNAQRIDIVSHAEGYLTELLVRRGDRVARGDVVARLESSGAARRQAETTQREQGIQREIEALERERDAETDDLRRFVERRRTALLSAIASAEALLDLLDQRIREVEANAADADDSVQRLLLPEQRLRAAGDLDRARSDLAQLDIEQNERAAAWRRRLHEARQRLAEQQAAATSVAAELEAAREVRAAADGEIVEVLAGAGTFLRPDDSIFQMTNRVSGLMASAFFAADEAELIEPGMQAQITLSTVSQREFGNLRGVVREVSRFRLSADALMTLLGNRQLVDRFSQSGAPLAIEIDLVQAPDGGLEWTGGSAPPFDLEPGMMATITIAVREERPITLVVPALRGTV